MYLNWDQCADTLTNLTSARIVNVMQIRGINVLVGQMVFNLLIKTVKRL